MINEATFKRSLETGLSRRTIALVLLLGVAAIVNGCGGMFKGKAAAEQSVADFHKLYNQGDLTAIYSASHPAFKGATTDKQFLEFENAVQRKLGKVTGTVNAGFNIRSFNLTTTIVLNQNTTFEQGTGTEVFTFQMNGEKALLVAYNINSKDLILR